MSSIASVKQSRHTSIVVMPSLRMTSLNAGGFSQGRPCSVEPQQVEFSFCNIVGISNVESMEKLRRCQSRNLEIKSNFPQQLPRKECQFGTCGAIETRPSHRGNRVSKFGDASVKCFSATNVPCA